MLVMSRGVNDVIEIGKDIAVCVISIKGDRVRLGIKAPLEIPIVRPDAKDKAPRKRERAA